MRELGPNEILYILAAVRWTQPLPDEVNGQRALPELAP